MIRSEPLCEPSAGSRAAPFGALGGWTSLFLKKGPLTDNMVSRNVQKMGERTIQGPSLGADRPPSRPAKQILTCLRLSEE